MNNMAHTNESLPESVKKHLPFLAYLQDLSAKRPSYQLSEVVQQAGGAQHVAVVTVDVVKGFLSSGAMSSKRVQRILSPVVRVLKAAHACGVESFFFTCDSHQPDSLEFKTWPVHCLKDSPESELEDELLELPFASSFRLIPKPCVSSLIDTTLVEELLAQPRHTLILMGDVTDLCLYQMAVGLKCLANARGLSWRIIVPSSCVETYDTPIAVAQELGILAHDGEFCDLVFKYHLQINGIEVVQDLLSSAPMP